MGLCAALGLFGSAGLKANPNEHDKNEHHGKVNAPDTAQGIVKEIHKHHEQLNETIKGKRLKEAHEHSDAIGELAKALPAKAPEANKMRVEGTVKNILKITGDIHHSSEANDQAKTEASAKKLDGVLSVLDSQIK